MKQLLALAKEAVKYKRKKKLGSYQYGSVIFSITLALFVIGIFGLLLIQTKQLTTQIQENVEIQVYLNKNVTSNQKNRIQGDLGSRQFTLRKDNQPKITFISKEKAAQQFIADTGEDFTEFLGENPLRDALVININPDFQSSTTLDSIKTNIESINGVFEVSYVDSLVESINKNLTNISVFLLGFAVILLIVVVMLIGSTIKLALFSQRFLIRSMQLVGATSNFIKIPFLKRAFIHGVIAGVLACAFLFGLTTLANDRIEGLKALQNEMYVFGLYGVLIILGGFIALVSSQRAMNKYLKMSLDELY